MVLASEANDTITSRGFRTQQRTLFDLNFFSKGKTNGWCDLTIQTRLLTTYSPLSPMTWSDVEVCGLTVEPVVTPVKFSRRRRRKEFPERGKVLNAIFYSTGSLSRKRFSPSNIQELSVNSCSSVDFSISMSLLRLTVFAVVGTTDCWLFRA
jgi:hypothetical protein